MRVMDDTFNYPLSLLVARLQALTAEAGNFTTVSGRLLDILANETRSLPGRAQHIFRARGRDRRTGAAARGSAYQSLWLARWFRGPLYS